MKIKCIANRTDSGFYVTNISDTLQNLQKFVGGYIEIVNLWGDAAIVCNEEGRIKGLPYNCSIDGVGFVGDILIVGTAGDELEDLDEDFIKDFKSFAEQYISLPYREEE